MDAALEISLNPLKESFACSVETEDCLGTVPGCCNQS